MPPKAQKGRSAKLSKAEKEKLKKEEAERKAKEEEEARLKEEQEKREQEERERLEREERQRLWEAEKARHQAEIDEVKEILENNSQKLKTLEEDQRSKAKWERYMLCDGSPDPLIENELNTFIHLWREEELPVKTKDVLEDCENTLKLMAELEWHIRNSEIEQPTEIDLHRYKETALDNVDPESQNLQYITSTQNITLCLWGNTAKNPRLKSVAFQKQGFTIEVPKSLAVGDVSIRVLLTAYDHLSPLAKSFYARQKKLPEVVVEPVLEIEDENKEQETQEQKASEEQEPASNITPKSASVVSRGSKTGKAKSGRTGSSKSNRSRRTSAKSTKSQSSEHASQKDPELDPDQADDAATKTDQSIDEVPPEIANVDDLEDDDDDDDDDVVDLRAFGVIGPVIFLELLQLPPQPKHVKTWTIQQIVSPNLKRIPYRNLSVGGAPGSASSTGPPPASASTTQASHTSNPPLTVTMKLPGNVMFFEQPQLAWWEPVKNQWRMDGITDVSYNDDQRSMTFKTDGFGPIATTQDLYLNMPFQSWEIRPHKVNSCVFTLIAAIIEMEIEIQDGLCCLGQPDDIEELSHLIGKWMKPDKLIEALKAAGVNVFPAEDADKYVSINRKDEPLENQIYHEMALTASSFAYSWSKWNAESGEDRIVLQTTEQLQDEMLLEEDWSLYLLSTKNSCQLKMREDDSEFSDKAADSTQLHSNLYHMLKDGASQEAQHRIQQSNFLFADCVYQLLSATKVVTYS